MWIVAQAAHHTPLSQLSPPQATPPHLEISPRRFARKQSTSRPTRERAETTSCLKPDA